MNRSNIGLFVSPRGAFYPLLLSLALWLVISPLPAYSQSQPGSPPASSEQGHVLGSGDMIEIRVHGEDDLSVRVRIEGNGYLSYPFLGDIKVAGMSVRRLQQLIDTGLRGDYLVDPDVRVFVHEYRPVYISGQVRSPGGYEYMPGMTVQQAVTLAGGFTALASQRRIFVIREGTANSERQRVNLDARLGPGDSLIVDEGLF